MVSAKISLVFFLLFITSTQAQFTCPKGCTGDRFCAKLGVFRVCLNKRPLGEACASNSLLICKPELVCKDATCQRPLLLTGLSYQLNTPNSSIITFTSEETGYFVLNGVQGVFKGELRRDILQFSADYSFRDQPCPAGLPLGSEIGLMILNFSPAPDLTTFKGTGTRCRTLLDPDRWVGTKVSQI